MREIKDSNGHRWDVVLGRESWGALFAIFIPIDGGTIRQTLLDADTYEDARTRLARMDDDAVRALLAESKPKES